MAKLEPNLFAPLFARWARRVRHRLLLRAAVGGASVGLLAAAVAAAALWWQRIDLLRPAAVGLGLVGALLGVFLAYRKRWSDTEVALFLDAKLEADELIATAVDISPQIQQSPEDCADEASQAIVRQAAERLSNTTASSVRVPVWRRYHSLGLLGAGLVAWVSFLPLPQAPEAPEPPPGVTKVTRADSEGLRRIEKLEDLQGRDPAQTQRLRDIAKQARNLREQLAKGLPKREALAKIAELRDAIAKERLLIGDQASRAGLEAAIRKLKDTKLTEKAAKSLGDGDLIAFEEEMQKLANRLEKEHREVAKHALEEAAKAARKGGAKELADALEAQRKLFERREAKASALRELARQLQGHLSEQAQKDLKEFGETGDPEAQRRLAEALGEALEGLSDEERKRLAENLKQRLQDGAGENMHPLSKEQLKDLAERLASPEGRDKLKQSLRELARERSQDAKRQQGLDDAERGGAQAQRELGMIPIPGGGQPAQKPGGGSSKGLKGSGGPRGHDESPSGQGPSDHQGTTQPVPGGRLRAKAEAELDPTIPMHGAASGRTPGGIGQTANQAGTGVLGEVGETEMHGVERSEVPEEYREQVGRYFQP